MYHAGLTLTLYLVFLFLKALGNSRCGHSCKISRVWEYPWEHLVRWKFSLYTPLQNFRQIDSYVVFIVWGLHCIYFLCSRSPRVWFWFFWHMWDFGESLFDGADPRTLLESHGDRQWSETRELLKDNSQVSRSIVGRQFNQLKRFN